MAGFCVQQHSVTVPTIAASASGHGWTRKCTQMAARSGRLNKPVAAGRRPAFMQASFLRAQPHLANMSQPGVRAWPQSLDDLPALPTSGQRTSSPQDAPEQLPTLIQLPGSDIVNPAPRPASLRSKTWFWPSGTFPEEDAGVSHTVPSRNGALQHVGDDR